MSNYLRLALFSLNTPSLMLLNHQQTLPSPSLTNPTSGSCPPQAGKSKTAFKGHLTPSTWVCTVPEDSEDPKYRKMLNRGAFCRFEKRRCREIKSMLQVSESVWFSVELYIKLSLSDLSVISDAARVVQLLWSDLQLFERTAVLVI